MDGWARLWLLVSLLAASALAGYGLYAHEHPGPRRFSDDLLSQAQTQFDASQCRVLRNCNSASECPQIQALNLLQQQQDFLDACGTLLLLVLVHRPDTMYPMPQSREHFSDAVFLYRYRHERAVSDFYAWGVFGPLGLFVGLWALYFITRRASKWVRAGFKPQPNAPPK